ncbi:MAG: flagellar hook-basal body protein [Eubacterium sp.]|nr:flagellar hook-basal body protein [Eubacterium sp.]
MVKGLYTAWTGMVNEMHRMDVTTNNLANADTNGYKKEGATAESFASKLAVKIKDSSEPGWRTKSLGDVTMGVKIGETYTNYEAGNLKVTDNKYDFAIDGDGFFAVSFTDKQGNTSVKYTRDGAFTIGSDGFLRTKDGDYILNQNGALNTDPAANNYVQIDPNQDFSVNEDGFVYQNGQVVAQIGMVNFEDYNFLSKYGENMYDLVDGGQVVASDAAMLQGSIEGSNVKIVDEMVTMITIARAYEANQKMIQTFDGMLDKAVNQVGKA